MDLLGHYICKYVCRKAYILIADSNIVRQWAALDCRIRDAGVSLL